MSQTVQFLLADCPGYFVPLIYEMAKVMKEDGKNVIFAATTPYYEHYKGVNLSSIGEIYYLSDLLAKPFDSREFDDIEFDYWLAYPTYVRDNYFLGYHRNSWDVYKRVVHFHRLIFEKHQPEIIISEPPSSSFLYIAFHLARKKNIPYLGYISARLAKHFNVFLDEFGEKLLLNLNTENELPHNLDDTIPDYMKDQQKLAWVEDGSFKKLFKMITTSSSKSIESGNTTMHQAQAYYKRLWRSWRYARSERGNVFRKDVNLDEKISILFPLHYRPEASTSVLARYYENDLELLKNIAFSLPHNAQLIVKEHKSAVGIRGIAFYRKMLTYPNTTLLHPDYNLALNLQRFDGVVVLTSTVGFEALQLGVPVLVLGNVFYADYPGAIRVKSFENLEKNLRKLSKITPVPNPEVMNQYLKHCFPGKFNYLNQAVVAPDNVKRLLRPIYQVLQSS